LTSAVVTIHDVPLSDWRFRYFGAQATNAAVAGNQANPAGDGIPNLVKYALGLVPTNSTLGSILTPALAVGGAFTVSFVRPDPPLADISYRVETSSNLTTWAADVGLPTAVEYSSNGTARVTYQTTSQVTATNRKFIRLGITPN
jgi:hypothetical protein